MTHPQDERLLTYAANRAKTHPDYLGWVLVRYVEQEHISEDGLAQRLGIKSHDLPRLALCLRPRAEHFIDDIKQISTRFNSDAVALAMVVRLVESVTTLATTDTGSVSAESGLLMAARVRKQQRQDGEGHDCDASES